MCYQESIGCQPVGGKAATCIESEPTQPQERGTHEDERYVVRCDGVSDAVIHAFAQQDGHDQCGDSGIDVYYCSSGEVDGSHFLQKSATPYPMSHGEVGKNDPQGNEYDIARELDSFGKGSQYQGWGDDGEHALEHDEQQFGNVACGQCVDTDAMQERFVEAAHDACERVARL